MTRCNVRRLASGATGATPLGLNWLLRRLPNVAALRQRWAGGRNPVGIWRPFGVWRLAIVLRFGDPLGFGDRVAVWRCYLGLAILLGFGDPIWGLAKEAPRD